MPKRSKNQNTYSYGNYNAICDVCGMKFKDCDLKEQWNGEKKLMVCEDDWEPRHEAEYFRPPKEDVSVPWARIDTAESGGTDIAGDAFPGTPAAGVQDIGEDMDSDDDGCLLYTSDAADDAMNG